MLGIDETWPFQTLCIHDTLVRNRNFCSLSSFVKQVKFIIQNVIGGKKKKKKGKIQ